MTRAEQLAEKVRKSKAKLAAQQQLVADEAAQLREAVRKETNRRRFRVGVLAEQAGLLAWDDQTLMELFRVLVTLAPTPDPVAVLQGLLVEHATNGICGTPVLR